MERSYRINGDIGEMVEILVLMKPVVSAVERVKGCVPRIPCSWASLSLNKIEATGDRRDNSCCVLIHLSLQNSFVMGFACYSGV